MSILSEKFEESKEVVKLEEVKQIERVAFSQLRRYLEWLKIPDIQAAQKECKEESRDLSNFYKKEHQFLLTLV
jgi:hypothetical protein